MSDPVAKRLKMDIASGSGVQRDMLPPPPRRICELGTQKFSEIIDTEAFVDKSLFIKTLLEENKMVVILAPRRFGKSTNMDMVREFVSGNKQLFVDNNLKIYKDEKEFFIDNCQVNPVIYLDFKRVSGDTIDSVLTSIKSVIAGAYCDHANLVKEDGGNYAWSDEKLKDVDFNPEKFVNYRTDPEKISQHDVIVGLKRLSWCLHVHYGKPAYVFIDEYDSPILKLIVKTNAKDEVLNEVINLISNIMSDFLKGNDHVQRGLINAGVRVAEVLSCDANNIIHYEFLNETFAPYFGFTGEEVDELFTRKVFINIKSEKINDWYNGYRAIFKKKEIVIYSTFSILRYLQESMRSEKPQLASYWVDSGSIMYLKELFAITEIRKEIESLINDREVEIDRIEKMSKNEILTLKGLIHQNLSKIKTAEVDLFLQFLLENGYLNVVKSPTYMQITTCHVQVPNEEIRGMLMQKFYCATNIVQKQYLLCPTKIKHFLDESDSLLKQRDKDTFIRFAKAVSQLFDKLLPNNEDELHSVLFTLLRNFKAYEVKSELSVRRTPRTNKRGRPHHLDILLILGDVGMVIELKFKDKSSDMAHTQIVTQGYGKAFDDYENITEKILLGLHMNQHREVSLTYTINDSVKESVTSSD